jgi:hypothetical protein
MKSTKKIYLTALALAAVSVGAWAQSSGPLPSNDDHGSPASAPAGTTTTATPPAPITAADVQALKDALAAQQQQIDRLSKQLQLREAQQSAEATSHPAESKPAAPQQVAVAASGTTATSAVPVQQESAPSPGLNLQNQVPGEGADNPMHSPVISIHFKGITITPGGFVEAAFIRRSRALAADITTPLNSLTMPGASQSSMSEFFGSARQSRPTVYVDGRLKNVEFSSYISGDFLSAGSTSTSTQTDSYTLRLRQAWGQAKFDNGWRFVGGQMWSLVTENREGIQPSDDTGKTNDARPMTIDPGYTVGFSFARQYAVRVTKDFGKKVWFAVAAENPQGTVTTHSNGDNFLFGSAGAGGGAYNNAVTTCTSNPVTITSTTTSVTPVITCTPAASYTFNPSPDVIAKIAFDPGFGHYEIFGLWDRFRDRVFPCGELASSTALCGGSTTPGPNALGAYNSSVNGGAFGVNARWNFDHKHIVFGLHTFDGRGTGRYGAGQLADLSVHANGTPDPIKNGQGLATLEWHGKKLDVYSYAGAEYDGRADSFDPVSGKQVGYGAQSFKNYGCYIETAPVVSSGFVPGALANCTGDTRALIEGTIGFWYRFYSGPRGKFQFGTQYSYVTRQTWDGATQTKGITASPEGLDGMVFTSIRYYLP